MQPGMIPIFAVQVIPHKQLPRKQLQRLGLSPILIGQLISASQQDASLEFTPLT